MRAKSSRSQPTRLHKIGKHYHACIKYIVICFDFSDIRVSKWCANKDNLLLISAKTSRKENERAKIIEKIRGISASANKKENAKPKKPEISRNGKAKTIEKTRKIRLVKLKKRMQSRKNQRYQLMK